MIPYNVEVYIIGDTVCCGDVPGNRHNDRVNSIYVSIYIYTMFTQFVKPKKCHIR